MAEERLSIVMLGDSLTAGFGWAGALPAAEVHNLGVSGDTTGDVLDRLDEVVELAPDKIFLLIGINNLGNWRTGPEAVMSGHLAIWHELRARLPQTRLYVCSLLPLDESRLHLKNRDLLKLNRQLEREARARGLTFIDLFPSMLDSRGQLRPDFTYDGLHLTEAAYRAWTAALVPYIGAKAAR